jgi:hypothetical protein
LRQGKSLEKLVEQIERSLANSEHVTVTAPKMLRDLITKHLREHDVVLTLKHGHHEVLIAIECRDRSRPITVNQVEGFWAKCQHTGITQGVIVATKGFYKSARIKAKVLNIACLDLEQAQSLNWFLAGGVEIYIREVRNIHWALVPIAESGITPTEFRIVDVNDAEITRVVLAENVMRVIRDFPVDPSVAGIQHARITFPSNKISVLDKATGNYIPLKELIAEVEYEIKREYNSFDFFTYSDELRGQDVTNVAVTRNAVDGVGEKLMFVVSCDGGIVLTSIPEGNRS